MIKGKEDITDKEFEEILLPFYNNYNDYLIKFVIFILSFLWRINNSIINFRYPFRYSNCKIW